MIVLGVDPSLNSCGVAVLIKNKDNSIKCLTHVAIKSKTTDDFYQKIDRIISIIEEMILLHKPTILGIEETFVNSNPASSLKLGIVRGAIIATCLRHKLAIKELYPNEIKKTITGNGKASKDQIEYMVKILLPGIQAKTDDEHDAIAIGISTLLLN